MGPPTLEGVLVQQLEAGRHLLFLVPTVEDRLDKGDSVRSQVGLVGDPVGHIVAEGDLEVRVDPHVSCSHRPGGLCQFDGRLTVWTWTFFISLILPKMRLFGVANTSENGNVAESRWAEVVTFCTIGRRMVPGCQYIRDVVPKARSQRRTLRLTLEYPSLPWSPCSTLGRSQLANTDPPSTSFSCTSVVPSPIDRRSPDEWPSADSS